MKKFLIVVILLTTFKLSSQMLQAIVGQNNQVTVSIPNSHWRFCGDTTAISGCVPTSSTTAYDSGVTGGNNATIVGTLGGGVAGTAYTVATGRAYAPYAFFLDGLTNYANPASFTNIPTFGSASTVMAWVKLSAVPSTGDMVLDYGGCTGGSERLFGIENSSGNALADFSEYIGGYANTTPLTLNVWHSVGYRYVTSDTFITVYVDGVGQTISMGGQLNTSNTGTIYIGNANCSLAGWMFSGLLGDVSIFDTALTDPQISAYLATQAEIYYPQIFDKKKPVWTWTHEYVNSTLKKLTV